jgi:Fe-S cluster biogenesis protein NfuA
MKEIKEQIIEILNSLDPSLKAHTCFLELSEITDNKVVIYCGGQCTGCDSKCIEEAIKEKLPDIEVIFL